MSSYVKQGRKFGWVLLFISQATLAVDLDLSLDSNPTEFEPGSTETTDYQMTISKPDGQSDVTSIIVTSSFTGSVDSISSLSWTCTAAGTSSCDSAGATVSDDTSFTTEFDLSGDSNDVTIEITSVTYNSDIFNDLTFTTEITDLGDIGASNNSDSATGNNMASASLGRVSETDISISVTDSQLTYTPGNSASYTITVANAGPSDAADVAVTDGTPPSDLNITSWSCTPVSSCTPNSGGTDVDVDLDLAASTQVEIVVLGNYDSDAVAPTLVYAVEADLQDVDASDPDGSPETASDSDTINPIANLSIAVDTVNPLTTNYTPGATETYEVIVTNTGPSDVSGVTVVDNNLSEFSSIGWTCVASSGSSCVDGTGNLNTTVDLAQNGTATFSVNVTFDSAYDSGTTPDPLVYTVTATNPAGYNVDSPDASKDLLVELVSDLTMTLDDGDDTYVPGLSGTFTATLTNHGPSDVTGVTVVDSDLSEISAISWTCSVTDANSSCLAGPDTMPVDTTVDLAAGDSAVFTIDVDYLSNATTNPLVYQITATNPAGVGGTSPAIGTDGNDELNRQVDLSITKESKVGDFVPSEPFTYTIVVTNAGPSDLGAPEDGLTPAENVLTVLDTIDTTLAEHPSECNGGTSEPCWEYCPSDQGVPNSDISPDNCPGISDIPLDNGYSMNVPMHLSAGSSSEIRIHARVEEVTGSNCDTSAPDDPADRELCNTVTTVLDDLTTENIGSQSPLSAFVANDIVVGTDLVVTKTDGLTAASPGTDISYEIVVRNDGFTDANGITVADMLPIYPAESAGFESGSISWVCETEDANACCVTQSTSCGLNSPVPGSGNDLMATIDLGGQSEVKFTVTGSISNLASGTISNTATATLPAGIDETDTNNNSATDDDTVLGAESDVSVTKELLAATVNSSNDLITDLQYEIIVTNNGPSFADNIEVDDLLSDDEFDQSTASWTCSIQGSGNCDEVGPIANGVIDTTVDLAVGSTATFNLTVSTDPSPQGSVVNTVGVKANGFDPVAINNTDTVEYALSGTARLRIDNDDALNTATPGLPTSYTVRVQNEGPDNVFGATVENLFPSELTDVEWTCSAISPIPGDLTLFQASDQTINGTDLILSPDGSHVYIASPDIDGASPYESRLYVFERNTTPGSEFGQITFIEYLTQGDSGIDGIEAIVEFQMSQDGAYLYALSTEPDDSTASVATFSRNNNRLSPDFGRLTFLNAVNDQMPASVVDMLLTPDQKHIYVTGDDEIIRYTRDTGTGLLSHDQTDLNIVAGHMVISTDGTNIYVVDEVGDQIDSYDRETDEGVGTFGDLTGLNSVTDTDIDLVSDMIFSADDKSIYLAATGTDKLVVIDRDLSSGMISFATSYNDADFSFEAGETLVGMNQLFISPDGEHVFVSNPVPSDSNDGNLLVLSRNSNGFLSKDQEISEEGTQGLSDVVVTQDGKQVLTTATDGKTLMAFDRRQPDPTFSFVEVEIDQQDDIADSAGVVDGLLGAAAVVVSGDGSHVYTAGIGANSIAVFERDSTKGSTALTRGEHLLYIDNYQDGASGITGLADVNSLFISPNGEFLYAGSRDESTLAVFNRNIDGTLTFVTSYSHSAGVTDGLLGISDIVIDDNSQSLYVVGQFEASVAHYSIDGFGQLTLVNSIANGDVGVSGMGGARAVTLTPDGDHLIVGSGIDDSIVVFDRSLIDGQISFLQHLPGVGDQPMDVAVSPDGEHIYVASANDSRLTVINRNNNAVSAEYGQVTINTSYVDNVGGFNELLGLRAVVVSPDGDKVYVGAEFDAAVSVLDRDTNPQSSSFGRLAVVEIQKDDVDGVNGLNQLYDLAVSRDSRHVYAVGFGDNALAAFVLGIGSSCSTQGSGNISDVVDIGANGTLTYSVSGTIRSDATGNIVTEARILPPNNFTVDLPLDNCANPTTYSNDNCDQDTTVLVPITDLAISKSNGQLSAVAGQPTEYEIIVTNAGPSDARSNATERVMVKDILVTNTASDQFEPGSISWTCEAVGSGSLTYLDAVINDVDGVQGLTGVSSLAYSDDMAGFGPHVIATSVIDNGLLIFSVDILTGELTQVLPVITASPGISLTGARDVLLIDNDIYVASQVDDALVAFKAQDNLGSLDIQWVENHEFPAVSSGLNQAVYVTSSSDGAHVYVAGANDDAVVIFDRNLATGVLVNTATVTGLGQGLDGVNTLAVSNDGYSVYTSGFNNNDIGRYSRDLISGDLTFIEVINSPGVEFDAVSSIEISPDDNHVYITSAGNHRVYTFARDMSVATSSSDYGSLSVVQSVEQGIDGVSGLLMPSDILISEDGRHAYVSSEQSDAVVWFARNESTGSLVFGGLISDLIASVDGLNGAIALASDSSGQYIYVAGSQDNGIAVLTRSSDSFCPAAGSGNLSELDGAIDAGIPVDLAVNGQLIFTVNATVAADATGTLTNEARVLSCELPLSDPVELCLGSDPNTTNNTAIDNDVLNPTADLMISKTDGVSEYEGLIGASQVTGDDQFLYVAASQDNAISIFKRESNSGDGEFGLLNYLGQRKNGEDGVSGLLGASDVILSTDGQTLYAAGSGDNSVVVFNKESNGQLTFVEKITSGVFGVTGIEGVSSLNVSSDGAHLYATGPLTNSLAVFEIDQSGGVDHGKLTFIQQLQNAVDGVSGLANASDVLVSPDNMHVYVTSESGHSVSLFLRNPNDASVSYGQLSYQASYIDDIGGIGGMLGAKKMTLDANGAYLYVLGSVDQALVVFSRDDTTGELSFVEFKQNGTSGVVGLNLARDLVISQDQQSLYVAGRGENALVRFNLDQIDGTLDFADVINDGDALVQPGTFVNGLSGAAGLFMPSDDQHLYVVADQDHSISVFDRDVISSIPDLGALSLNDVLINGRGGVAPGTELTYLIVASNAGPSDVEKARVVDVFPPEFQSISFECFPLLGAGCTTGVQSGNVDVLVDLPVGSSVEILATGVLRPDASGIVTNTATIASSTVPEFAVSDPDLTNNTATDDDTVLFVASDLTLTKDNGVTESIPGGPVSYTITVSNDATLPNNNIPADVSGVVITDVVPEAISDVSWTCQAFPLPGLLDDGDGNDATDNYISYTELDLFNDLIIHSNEELAYAVGESAGESVLLVYQRNSRSGDLIEIQRVASSDTGINGLQGAQGVAISPDSKQLYVVSNTDDAITTWTIDAITGLVTYAGVLTDGISGVNGLGGAVDVLATSDGLHVYVAGKADNAIAIFNRDIGSGLLSYNSFLTGVEGLSGVNALVQAGSYIVVASEANQSVATFTRSIQNGLLVSADVIQDFELPGSVLSQPKDVVFVNDQVLVAGFGSDAVSIFNLDANDGMLNFASVISQGDPGVTHLEGPESITVSNNGELMYVGSSVSEAIMLFIYNGETYDAASTIYDITLIPDLDSVNQVVMSSGGAHLYALSDELVLTVIQNGSSCTQNGTGSLNDVANIVSMGYVEYTLNGTILPTASGVLSNTATALMSGDAVELNPVDNADTDEDTLVPTSDLSVTKDDGLIEVVAGTDLQYDIAVFSAGPSAMDLMVEDLLPIYPTATAGFESQSAQWACSTSRALQTNGLYTDDGMNGLSGGSHVTESPDGNFVYVVSNLGTLSVFSKDTSGILTLVQLVSEADELPGGDVVGLAGAVASDMDSQGQNLYVISNTGNQVIVFNRNALTGVVDYQQTLSSGDAGIIGLLGPVDVEVTPDDSGLYVASNESDAIAVFSRALDSGELSFVERVKDGFGTIVPESNVILEITDLGISADGLYLYTTADFSEAVAIFSRDPSTQVLTFEAVIRAGDVHGGVVVPAMSGSQSLQITNNGDFIYTAVEGSSSLFKFKRSDIDGSLTFESQLSHGDAGAGSLEIPNDLRLTPNGGKLLVTDQANNMISVYDRNTVSGDLTLIDEIDVNSENTDESSVPVSMYSDGVNVYVLLNQVDSLLAIRITAAAECQLDSETSDTPLIPLYMAPGSLAQVQISARVHPSARGTIMNIANVVLSPGTEDNNLSNNSAFDDTDILVQTDVSIVKNGPSDAIAGEFIEYQLILTNSGPSDALGVVVNDIIPTALLNSTWSCSATERSSCSNSSGAGNLSESVDVTIDGEVIFTITSQVDPSFSGMFTNEAVAVTFEDGFDTDTDSSNNTDQVTTNVTQVADLSVVKANSTTQVVAGEPTSYQITFSNAGPSDGDSVVVDIMPDNLEQVTWQCTPGSGSSCPATGRNNINTSVYVAANSQLVFQVDAIVASSAIGQVNNEAMIDPVASLLDPDLSNNVSTDIDDVTQVSDLSVVLDDLIDPYDPASPFDLPFSLKVINLGPSDATNVGVNLPLQLDVTADTVNVCSVSDSGVNCDIGYSIAGEEHDYIVNYRLNPSLTGQIDNLAEATSDTFDPILSNNIDTTVTDLLSGVDIRVTQDNGHDQVEPGQVLTYEITVENLGSIDAGEVIIDEQLPTGLINASWSCEAFEGAQCINVDEFAVTGGADLPSGGYVVMTLIATVDPALFDMSESEITNTVEVVLVSGTDFNLLNNISSDTDTIIFYIFRNGFEEVTP